jgi:hypothetical protein
VPDLSVAAREARPRYCFISLVLTAGTVIVESDLGLAERRIGARLDHPPPGLQDVVQLV